MKIPIPPSKLELNHHNITHEFDPFDCVSKTSQPPCNADDIIRRLRPAACPAHDYDSHSSTLPHVHQPERGFHSFSWRSCTGQTILSGAVTFTSGCQVHRAENGARSFWSLRRTLSHTLTFSTYCTHLSDWVCKADICLHPSSDIFIWHRGIANLFWSCVED